MAAGVCVLTSDIPENNEVVEGAGFTFHRGDQADLERMLDLLIHNPEFRRQSAVRERERIQGSISGPKSPVRLNEPITAFWAGAPKLPSESRMRRANQDRTESPRFRHASPGALTVLDPSPSVPP